MRVLILWLFCMAGLAQAQTLEVDPKDLVLTVSVENVDVTPYQGEMILLTIHGVYRRHITLEHLIQPELSGFNWMQLGQDHWYETQIRGKTVKNFRRRMALFPEEAGELTIEPFVHHLTLTDEGDDWFEHDIHSEPLTINVNPAPPVDGWWFPVRRLEISDQWSNAPDQLNEGEGVLRVIKITATGDECLICGDGFALGRGECGLLQLVETIDDNAAQLFWHAHEGVIGHPPQRTHIGMAIQCNILKTRIRKFHAHNVGDTVLGTLNNTCLERGEQFGPRDRCWRRAQ